MTEEDPLQAIRERIDELDQRIQMLINERAVCAQEVARIKQETDPDDRDGYYRPEREAQVLRAVQQRNQGPLSNEEVARLFRQIMSACLALEEPLNIAFLGPEGTFTQAAAYKHFGHSVNTMPLAAIDEVFREVEAGAARYGVVPVENSTEGVINHTLDMFMQSPLQICGEVELRIHHNLIGLDTDISHISKVYSHQQSLAQCREWLDAKLPGVERVAVSSNAEAARLAAEDSSGAAIAGETAAEIYQLNILIKNIEDDPDNTTRFLIIGNQMVTASGQDKTSMILSVNNESGALQKLLLPFQQHGISMTKIESRPSRRGMWDYVFFVDIEGHRDDDPVKKALQKLKASSSLLKVLGSYPCAVL